MLDRLGLPDQRRIDNDGVDLLGKRLPGAGFTFQQPFGVQQRGSRIDQMLARIGRQRRRVLMVPQPGRRVIVRGQHADHAADALQPRDPLGGVRGNLVEPHLLRFTMAEFGRLLLVRLRLYRDVAKLSAGIDETIERQIEWPRGDLARRGLVVAPGFQRQTKLARLAQAAGGGQQRIGHRAVRCQQLLPAGPQPFGIECKQAFQKRAVGMTEQAGEFGTWQRRSLGVDQRVALALAAAELYRARSGPMASAISFMPL